MQACDFYPGIIAVAHIYFERLVLKEKVNKENRKVLAAICVVLAIKFMESKDEVEDNLRVFFKVVEERWKVSRPQVFRHEFQAFADLDFELTSDPGVGGFLLFLFSFLLRIFSPFLSFLCSSLKFDPETSPLGFFVTTSSRCKELSRSPMKYILQEQKID